MKTRVITAIVMIAVFIPFFIFSHTIAFPIFASLLAAIGVFEMQGCIGSKKHLLISVPSVIIAVCIPFIARYFSQNILSYMFIVSFAIITYTFVISVFSKHKYAVETAAISSSTTVYISFGFASIVLLRDLEFGRYVYFLAFIIPWITDTFAYFCGRAFGKHKLIPDVSPKKTVEGSIGGTIFAILITLIYGFVISKATVAVPNYLGIAVVAFIVSLLSQCGDLIMSLIKRKFEIKDYGKIFPGHGGILDRFDSIIATAPFIYFLGEFVPILKLFS